ncbi:MAG: DUF3422 family protein [Paracoccaceae bacterium]
MSQIVDHPLRYALTNELHARPFPTIEVPGFAAYLAIEGKPDERARAHLLALLDRCGATHPQPGATHYFGDIGKHKLKWEQHAEFVTYTIFGEGNALQPFDPATFNVFPSDWLAGMPGRRITSALIRVELMEDDKVIPEKLDDWLVSESLAVSSVLDDAAVIAGDYRIDPAGHLRFAVFVRPDTGTRRVGRIVQRLCEIETYKTMAMLGLMQARDLSTRIEAIDGSLTRLVEDMCRNDSRADETLAGLLAISAELENMLAKSSFRFSATGAYEAIVHQRIKVLREERFDERQTFAEFMSRRFDPAMRTVKSTEKQLRNMAAAAIRAGELLRTQVDVERSAQNQLLLESMDRRADLQLRLQKTVEGLSVVAISYYAVNLAAYMAYPFTTQLGLSKGMATAVLTPVVVLLVWLMVKRIRKMAD